VFGCQSFVGNTGEWSEIYVFLKLLADGKLYAADADLNRIADMYYPIIKIMRTTEQTEYEYCRDSVIKVVDCSSRRIIAEIELVKFLEHSLNLFQTIKLNKGKGVFNCEEIELFLRSIHVDRIKANSKDKKDITLVVHDSVIGVDKILGFSIKSRLGEPSTLINAGKTTNFIFRVEDTLKKYIKDINSIYNLKGKISVRKRIERMYQDGKKLIFSGMHSLTFKHNLQLIDSLLPDIVAEMLLAFYNGEGTTVKELTNIVSLKNPCDYDMSEQHCFYEYKIKNLLTDAALGMLPSEIWNGMYNATGGYIIVKENGDVLCYHIYNRNEFQDYLFNNTKLETPSTTRHEFGKLYGIDDQIYFDLNFQVRFIPKKNKI
jgi:type II restriction enzyme